MVEKFLNLNFLESIGLIAIEAGKSVMDVYAEDFDIKEKKPNHPVTKADIKSHLIIKKKLENKLPNTHFFSEESNYVTWDKRQKWKSYWLVDPLDGTKEFINRNDEFTINIALINNFSPILGVIYAPCINKIFLAAKGVGLYSKKINVFDKHLSLDLNSKINIQRKNRNNNLKIICSRSHKNIEEMNEWLRIQKKYELNFSGSSIKFCLIAEGKADIYPRFRPTSEWDIAAGHCILKEAGGNIRTFEGNEIKYNTKESLTNPNFIASID